MIKCSCLKEFSFSNRNILFRIESQVISYLYIWLLRFCLCVWFFFFAMGKGGKFFRMKFIDMLSVTIRYFLLLDLKVMIKVF